MSLSRPTPASPIAAAAPAPLAYRLYTLAWRFASLTERMNRPVSTLPWPANTVSAPLALILATYGAKAFTWPSGKYSSPTISTCGMCFVMLLRIPARTCRPEDVAPLIMYTFLISLFFAISAASPSASMSLSAKNRKYLQLQQRFLRADLVVEGRELDLQVSPARLACELIRDPETAQCVLRNHPIGAAEGIDEGDLECFREGARAERDERRAHCGAHPISESALHVNVSCVFQVASGPSSDPVMPGSARLGAVRAAQSAKSCSARIRRNELANSSTWRPIASMPSAARSAPTSARAPLVRSARSGV